MGAEFPRVCLLPGHFASSSRAPGLLPGGSAPSPSDEHCVSVEQIEETLWRKDSDAHQAPARSSQALQIASRCCH